MITDKEIMEAYATAIAQGGSADSVIIRTCRALLTAPPLAEPVTFVWTTTIREHLEDNTPDEKCGDDWTKGYEECKRRILRMLQQPINEKFNTPASEGPQFSDGCDHEGFVGGCERFGHTVETCPALPASEVKPVGFASQTMIDGLRSGKRVQSWILPKKKDDPDFCDMDVPLYTHADDGLRKAAEVVLEEWEAYGGISEEAKNDLRAELDKK